MKPVDDLPRIEPQDFNQKSLAITERPEDEPRS